MSPQVDPGPDDSGAARSTIPRKEENITMTERSFSKNQPPIVEFAEKYGKKYKKQPNGMHMIVGAQGEIFDFMGPWRDGETYEIDPIWAKHFGIPEADRVGVDYKDSPDPTLRPSLFGIYFAGDWLSAKRRLKKAGFAIHQDGDFEGSALFDPTNKTQARLALELIKARAKRVLSLEEKLKLVQAGEKTRLKKVEVPEEVPA